ncbi:MAG: hypothetical protein IT178_00680 [Acidobacteria bacterium]|nr:hypothetical protein [Acidobacteriota bacterium]
MTSHAGLLALFALFVSLVFAVIGRDTPAEQVRLGLQYFAAFLAAGFVLGWLMYPLPL